jgi:hypothetical protein
MTDEPKTPAARVIARFTVEKLAGWTGRHRSRVHAWTWPTDRGGTGGVVPTRVRQKIIDGARADLNETVTFADFEPMDGEQYLSMGGAQ